MRSRRNRSFGRSTSHRCGAREMRKVRTRFTRRRTLGLGSKAWTGSEGRDADRR